MNSDSNNQQEGNFGDTGKRREFLVQLPYILKKGKDSLNKYGTGCSQEYTEFSDGEEWVKESKCS